MAVNIEQHPGTAHSLGHQPEVVLVLREVIPTPFRPIQTKPQPRELSIFEQTGVEPEAVLHISETSSDHNRQKTPEQWAKWILSEEDRYEARAKAANRDFFRKSPKDIASWVAGLSGATDRLVALLNEVENQAASGRINPQDNLALEEKTALIYRSADTTNRDPYRTVRSEDVVRTVTPEDFSAEKISRGISPFRSIRPEEYFLQLKGHPMYHSPVIELPRKATVAAPAKQIASESFWKRSFEGLKGLNIGAYPQRMAQEMRMAVTSAATSMVIF
jgi:hypothetical protein